MWAGLAAGVAQLALAAHFEWKIRRDRRLAELRAEEGDDDSSAWHWWAGDEPRRELWMAAGLAALLCVFWVAFFANLLGFTADGARRLSMSAERALASCMPGKVLGALGVVGSVVFVQTAVVVVLLAGRIPPVDRAIPFFVAAFSLLGLAGGGAVVSIWLPRKPKLHEQRDFYCSVPAMAVLGCGWLIQVAIFGGALVAARLLGGPGVAMVTATVLLLVVAAGCAALVAALAKGDWLRRRLREWAVAV